MGVSTGGDWRGLGARGSAEGVVSLRPASTPQGVNGKGAVGVRIGGLGVGRSDVSPPSLTSCAEGVSTGGLAAF